MLKYVIDLETAETSLLWVIYTIEIQSYILLFNVIFNGEQFLIIERLKLGPNARYLTCIIKLEETNLKLKVSRRAITVVAWSLSES